MTSMFPMLPVMTTMLNMTGTRYSVITLMISSSSSVRLELDVAIMSGSG